ncbi:MAG: DNA polymerase III subunit gamma/tau [Candidatus Ryanbacteria bacterium]|nr:DNA polymerase III subunit gamma/tau [Candidatus Ryanbacteria bacterium]
MQKSEHVVLYRKYRPQRFSDVVGQDHIVSVLKNALRLERVSHAYIFSGTRGTGKTTLARLLAKAFNCEKRGKDGEPCNTCDICKDFSSGRAFDLVEIDAASNRGIDDIRELKEAVRFTPMRAKRKVYIIDEVHMLTKDAFNALLKTLEEPPAHAMFIMATTELDRVPDTILSRSQSFEFRRIAESVIREELMRVAKSEKYKIDSEGITMLAFLADGSMRDGETMLGQVMDAYPESADKDALTNLFGLPKIGQIHELIDAALKREPIRVLDALGGIRKDGIEPKLLSRMLVHEARELFVSAYNPKDLERLQKELSETHAAFFTSHHTLPKKDIEQLLVKLLEAHNIGFRGTFPDLPLELALLSLSEQEPQKTLEKPAFLK